MSRTTARPTLHEYSAFALILIGMVVAEFIQLRPNRIEKGTDMGFRVAIGDQWVLIAAFFCCYDVSICIAIYRS